MTYIPSAAPAGGTPALTLGTTNTDGASGVFVETDAAVAIFDATAPVTQAFGDSAATGSAAKAARRDHTHGMPATPSTGAMTLITDTTTGSDVASVTFSSIPGTYKHLVVFYQAASDQTNVVGLQMRFNSDSGSNYDYEQNAANNGTASISQVLATTSGRIGHIMGVGSPTAGGNGTGQISIPNYATTTWHKYASNAGASRNLSANADFTAGVWGMGWRNTAAITAITLLGSAGNIKTGSRFTLYGIS